MSLLNGLVRWLFDRGLYPFRELPAVVGLSVLSLVTAVALLLVFRATSDQARIAAVKRQIHACLYEMRLYNDDLRALFRSQFDLLRHNLTYLRLSFVPLLWVIVPLSLLLYHLEFHYAYAGLWPGASAVFKVRLDPSSDLGVSGKPQARLEAPLGLSVETPAVWIPSRHELLWRLKAEDWGHYDVTVHVDGQSFTKEVVVSAAIVRRAPTRPRAKLLEQLEHPAEAPLPERSPIDALSLAYPKRDVSLFGWETHWAVAFLILSLVFAFALRKRLGVSI